MKKPGHMVAVAFPVILLLYMVLTGGKTFSRDLGYILLFTCIIQFYRSSRKYGLFKTTELYASLLFLIIGYIVTLLGSHSTSDNTSEKITPFDADIMAQNLKTLICETHSCTIEKIDIQKDGFYVYLNIPYGIYPPFEKITQTFANQRSIPLDLIRYNESTPQKIYFFFPNVALTVYTSYSVLAVTKNDLKTLADKLLLRTPSI